MAISSTAVNVQQTGSGKTYTMWGPQSAMLEGQSSNGNQGIVPRVFQMLFDEIQKVSNSVFNLDLHKRGIYVILFLIVIDVLNFNSGKRPSRR